MRLFSWNVNGIRSVVKKGDFSRFIQDYSPDILALQETKAIKGQAEIDLPEYSEYWNSATKKGYSGTAIFSKIKPIATFNDIPGHITKQFDYFEDKYGNTLSEGRIITAEYIDFYFVTVYTPNSKADLSRLKIRHLVWDPAFLLYLKYLEQTKPVIFCGDLNVAYTNNDLSHPESNLGKHGFTDEERNSFSRILNAGFVDTFRIFNPSGKGCYTWWAPWARARPKNIGWRIDYFLVSDVIKDRIKSANIYTDVMGSDHCPVGIEFV